MKVISLKSVERLHGKTKQEIKMDVKVVKAVQLPNSRFFIEKLFAVPGKTFTSFSSNIPMPFKVSTLGKIPSRNIQEVVKSQKLFLQKQQNDEEETATVKVESIGMTAADQPIPDYSAFFPKSIFMQEGSGDEATLILEPDAKAVSGNDGTSISAPVSRAVLRKGTAVKVLYRPQSVSISGSNGISHAQADLILDFIQDE